MGATMRVLVLDDKPDAALLRVLRTMGAVPLVARTEEEAIVIINGGIDAAIVDMQLEPNWRYGGITVIRYLREHLGDSVPVILFTGHLDAGAGAECEHLKARYVVKPGPTIASLVDYLRENLPAATRRRSGVRASATASKDPIASTCARQEECNLSAMETVVLEEAARAGRPVLEEATRGSQPYTAIDLAREEAYAKAIAAAAGNLTQASRLLGVSRQAVQNFIARRRR